MLKDKKVDYLNVKSSPNIICFKHMLIFSAISLEEWMQIILKYADNVFII